MNDLEREVGRLSGVVDRFESDISELRKDMKTVLSTLSEARGSWKTLVAIGAISGAAGAFVAKLGMWTGWLPK